ncbi:MAG: YtoQ family protein [Planctomycetaceae bacterium]
MNFSVYLAGEIHSDWRTELCNAAADLPIEFCGPVTDHSASDNRGAEILGAEDDPFWHDRKGAGLNAIRTRAMLQRADAVVVRFGEKYRQWNAAFDAGIAVALRKPLIVMHPPEFRHALKELDAAACAVAETTAQVVEVLRYAFQREDWMP